MGSAVAGQCKKLANPRTLLRTSTKNSIYLCTTIFMGVNEMREKNIIVTMSVRVSVMVNVNLV